MQFHHPLLILITPLLLGIIGVDMRRVAAITRQIPFLALLAVPPLHPVLLLQATGYMTPLGELTSLEDVFQEAVLLHAPWSLLGHLLIVNREIKGIKHEKEGIYDSWIICAD